MDLTLAGAVAIVLFLALLFLGMPIAFSAALVAFLGIWIWRGTGATIAAMGIQFFDFGHGYSYSVIPLFILMGHLAMVAGFARDAYEAGRRWVGWLPGGLASATTVAGALFAAICASTVASSVTLTKLCLPEMEKHNYSQSLAAGTIASVGCLASLIPPSILMVLYGIVMEVSIGKLLIAGIIPGVLTAIIFIVEITLLTWRRPTLAPRVTGVTLSERLASLKSLWSMLILFIMVIGGIYSGIVTPTEAGAVGVLGVLIIGLLSKRLNWRNLWAGLMDAGAVTARVFILVIGIKIFVGFLAVTGVGEKVGASLISLSSEPLVILALLILIYTLLGMVMESMGMLLLTAPFVIVLIETFGWDPVWFGIFFVINAEIGMIVPPVGQNCFWVKGAAPHVPLESIFRGVLIFWLGDMIVLALIIAFPQIVLFLPNMMTK